MKNELTVFENKMFGAVRVIEIDGEPWFVGKDVAECLGYTNVSDAVSKHVDVEDKQQIAFRDLQNYGLSGFGTKGTSLINESGIYSLIMGSKLPSAKEFKRWVTSEVIPSIRKHGAYMTPDTIELALSDPDFIIGLATRLKEEQLKTKELEAVIEEQEPKVKFADALLRSNENITIEDFAKSIAGDDVKTGRNRMYRFLRDRKVLKSNGQHKNKPYQTFINRGYFLLEEYVYYRHNEDKIGFKTLITPKGQSWLVDNFYNELQFGF